MKWVCLKKYSIRAENVLGFYKICRRKGEQYSEIVERIRPDNLIEDDCRSIGGQKEWCITNVKEEFIGDSIHNCS